MKAQFYLPQVHAHGDRMIVMETILCDEGDEVFLGSWQALGSDWWIEYEQGSRPYLLKMIELMHNSTEELLRDQAKALYQAYADGRLDYLLSVSIMKDFSVDRVELRRFEL